MRLDPASDKALIWINTAFGKPISWPKKRGFSVC